MTRIVTFALYFLAIFLQAGAYGLTFMLPKLFASFGANEKVVGTMLTVTAVATLIAVYYSGHLSDKLGRVLTLAMACGAIAIGLFLFGISTDVGALLVIASASLGAGWGLTYSLGPVVLTRLIRADERVRYFTLLSVFVMAGFGLSPVLAAYLSQNGFTVNHAFHITAFLCVISALLFVLLIKPIRHHALNAAPEASSRLSLSNIAQIFKSRAVVPVIMVCLGASVFAGMNNFQTVFADERGLDYQYYFLAYTVTVVVFRIILAKFKGGDNPYKTIAVLQYIMCASVVLFMLIGGSAPLYIVVAFLFGIGYGVSYPILVAMAAHDSNADLVPQTLQLFALTYFIGIFVFPLIAGWLIVDFTTQTLLVLIVIMAAIEASMALKRGIEKRL